VFVSVFDFNCTMLKKRLSEVLLRMITQSSSPALASCE
jgi:hypothetical protein